jgi:hypothetical protein
MQHPNGLNLGRDISYDPNPGSMIGRLGCSTRSYTKKSDTGDTQPYCAGLALQNSFAEWLIGSNWRKCIDRKIVLGEARLRRILMKYAAFNYELRTHQSLKKDAPIRRAIWWPSSPLL